MLQVRSDAVFGRLIIQGKPRLCRGVAVAVWRFRGSIEDTPGPEPPSTRLWRIPMDEFESLSHTTWDC